MDYSDDFELPVFRSAASAEAARASQLQASSGAVASGFPAAPAESDSSAVAQPARTKVVVSMHSGGTDFYFPAFRNPGRALGLLVFTLIWSGVVYFLYSRAPLFFFVVFGLFDLLLVYGVLHVTLGSARIGVANGEILSRTGILGLGSTRRIPASDVASIVPVVSMQQGGASGNALYAIRLRMKSGRKYTLADEIDSRQEARWVVAQIETLAGLKLDTHVEVDSTFGVSSPPPQPGTGQVFTRPHPKKSMAASVGVFALVTMAMFGWVFWRTPTGASRGSGSRAAAASRPNPVSRRVFSAPMTGVDVERVLALPGRIKRKNFWSARLAATNVRSNCSIGMSKDGSGISA